MKRKMPKPVINTMDMYHAFFFFLTSRNLNICSWLFIGSLLNGWKKTEYHQMKYNHEDQGQCYSIKWLLETEDGARNFDYIQNKNCHSFPAKLL